jgi:hypothetical protein
MKKFQFVDNNLNEDRVEIAMNKYKIFYMNNINDKRKTVFLIRNKITNFAYGFTYKK